MRTNPPLVLTAASGGLTAPGGRSGLHAAAAFARAAPVYWGSVYPRICVEVADRRRQAERIPDPVLRAAALRALAAKRVNIDGAAAFACLVPAGPGRAAVIRAQLAFQSIYDYLDVVSEQPHAEAIECSRRLHGALLAALEPEGEAADARITDGPSSGRARGFGAGGLNGAVTGEAHAPGRDFYGLLGTGEAEDGGYLVGMVERCRLALAELPSYPAVRAPVWRLARHIVDYQSFNVGDGQEPRRALEGWGRRTTPPGEGLGWWETAAAAGSSLGLFALVAMAARPGTSAEQAEAVERAYFPWIGALHSLLDSLIDLPEDIASGQQALVGNYGDPDRIAAGLARLARESRSRAEALPHADLHLAILAAMASIYLAEPAAMAPHARRAREEVLAAIGGLTRPAMAVMRLRRLLAGR